MKQLSIFDSNSGAVLSQCGKYRYELWRVWDDTKPKVLFVMLNPSTADAANNDPTIRRCIGFAKSWGYGGVMVGNLFALRATDPAELKKIEYNEEHYYHADQNAQHLNKMAFECKLIVYAWGNCPVKNHHENPLVSFGNLHHLGLTKKGNPRHPLYVPKIVKLVAYPFPKAIFG